jgi:hypothetical protein
MLKEYKLNWALDTLPTELDSKDELIYQLIEETANDTNSSKFREDVTKWMVGLEISEGKRGYDDDFQPIEVKPKNYTGKSKLNGGGTFSDFTWRRDKKYSDDGCIMLISGFCYGKLVFVVQFDYKTLQPKIQRQLESHLPDGDKPSRYVRSASFSYLDWKDDFELKYISPNFDDFKGSFTSGLYQLLKKYEK